jgi:hypothetical protein
MAPSGLDGQSIAGKALLVAAPFGIHASAS